MKNRYHIIILFSFLIHPFLAQATAMAPDIIAINGEEWNLLGRPIKADSDTNNVSVLFQEIETQMNVHYEYVEENKLFEDPVGRVKYILKLLKI